MLSCITRTLYGPLPAEKLMEALTFSLLLCFVVGIYWMMRSLKDSVFATIVGLEHQPQAKMLSLVVVTVVLFVYNKVVDLVPRHQLFTIVCGAYSAIFVGTAACLSSTTIGLYGPDGSALPASPERWLGWVHYFAIESYGSLVVSLFWQYTNSQVNLADAKSQYGIIVAGGQVGAITGCSLVVGSRIFGVAQLYAAGGLLTLVAPLIVAYHHRRFGSVRRVDGDRPQPLAAAAAESDAEQASKEGGPPPPPASSAAGGGKASSKVVAPGLFEGLRLLLRHPCVPPHLSRLCPLLVTSLGLPLVARGRYVLGIFAVSALFEIIATILDYQMKVLGKASHHVRCDKRPPPNARQAPLPRAQPRRMPDNLAAPTALSLSHSRSRVSPFARLRAVWCSFI